MGQLTPSIAQDRGTASACGPGQFGDPITLAGYGVLVDAALDADGTSLVGTLVYDTQRITIRLQKQGSPEGT